MAEHGERRVRKGPGLRQSVDANVRHGLAIGGGAVSLASSILSGEAALKAAGIISTAQDSGIQFELFGISGPETLKTIGMGLLAYTTGRFAVNRHREATALESGRPAPRSGH